MSLINQMLRDLESRNATNNASTLQHNVQATQSPASKWPMLIGSLLAIIVASGTYWAYLYNKTQADSPPAIAGISKDPVPSAPYEKVLAVPNAITSSAPKTEQKLPEITAVPSVTVAQAVPEIQPAPVEPKPQAQPMPAAPEIVAERPIQQRLIVPNPAPVKQLTSKQQADSLFRQAENNIDDHPAAYKLEQILKLDPRHLKARLLLAKTLFNQGQVNKTADFLDQSLSLFPDNLQFINTRAQLFLTQKNPNGALTTLQHIDVTNSSNETYLSLLAATYQQLESSANAAKVYQRLVTVNPEKAENWLGLALSQEKLGNIKLASAAYQQALNKNTLKESIVSYIKQRLTELR